MNMNRLLLSIFWMFATVAFTPTLFALDSDWPRTVPLKQGMVTIYSPQIYEMSDNTIQYRAALAYRATAGAEPVFGAGWFESPVKVDSENRIVHPTQFILTETRFPEGTDNIQPELATVLAQQSSSWNLDFSVDELDSALKTTEAETRAVNTAPPEIIYRDHPALLISIDGEPVLREIENSKYESVINTPYPLIFDGKYYYLNAAKDVWYRARRVTGPYQFEPTPPRAIASMVNPDDEATEQAEPSEPVTASNAPEIVVSTEPAELIVSEGPAAFVPLVDDLLVLQNSEDDVFMHVSSQKFYIVLAGRWYQSGSLTGPWSYQAADELPDAFANIPRDSNQADSRVYVAGTEEARDAVLDAQVPQTAAVKRGEVDIEVKYDGEPVYQAVDGTDLVYIQNTGSTVLVSGGLYYLVEEGVWYVSSSSTGPWQVSDHRPEQVDTILPTSPVYNTKYVHVYDSTPSVVYVGYTPGYTGSFVYRNSIFYGTGWYYRPWVSPYYYYPRFSTWGFNVSYNSWSGWNFGLSWGWGPFSVNYYSGGYWHHNHYWHHRHHGRWGPGRYRGRPSHHRRGHDRYAHNGRRGGRSGGYDRGHEGGSYSGGRDGGRNSRPRGDGQNHNLYRDESQRARVANTRDRQARSVRYTGNSERVNNRYTDGRRVKSYAGKGKPGTNRIGVVSPSELNKKARLRDVNLEANRSRLLADNSGNVYEKAKRKSNRAVYTGGERNREPSELFTSSRSSKTRTTASRGSDKSSVKKGASNRQPQRRSSNNRQREPATTRAPVRQSRATTPAENTRQRPPSGVKSSSRQKQPKMPVNQPRQQKQSVTKSQVRQPQQRTINNRQRTESAVKSPARQSRQVSNRNITGRKSAPQASAQRERQNSPAAAPRTKNSRSNGPKNSAPAQKAPQRSRQQRSEGKSGGGSRERNSRGRSGK